MVALIELTGQSYSLLVEGAPSMFGTGRSGVFLDCARRNRQAVRSKGLSRIMRFGNGILAACLSVPSMRCRRATTDAAYIGQNPPATFATRSGNRNLSVEPELLKFRSARLKVRLCSSTLMQGRLIACGRLEN